MAKLVDNSPQKELVKDFMATWKSSPLHDGLHFVDPSGPMWISDAAGATGNERNTGTEFTILRWLQLLQPIVDAMPAGLEIINHRMIAESEWVAVDAESLGRLNEHAQYNMRYTFWFNVRDNKIVAMKQFYDSKYGQQFFASYKF